jgi:transcription elongation GreA/GreB family factor
MSTDKINKEALITLIINNIKQELNQAVNAANEAHAAAVDDQSVAETQYDTLAIEASYLAEGQSRRVQELQNALQGYKDLSLVTFNEKKPIALTAFVQLFKDSHSQHWFFIGPAAGGFRCELSGQHITVITPHSPMGLALIDKYQDDDIEIALGNNQLSDYIFLVK